MQFDKSTVMDLIKQHGDDDQTRQADQELPDKVDSDKNSGLLQKFGVDPQELIRKYGDKLPGGLGDKLGGMMGS